MSTIKIITSVNWVLIGIYGALVLYALLQLGSDMGHEMPGVGSIIKGVAVLLLLAFVGLNWLPHQWTKVLALIFEILLFLLVYVFLKDRF